MATILLIEDNPHHARLTIKVLGQHQHVVIHALSALEGLRKLHELRPDLVLLDIELPDLDGKTVANRLKRMPEMEGIPVVALSSNHSQTTQKLAIAYGCDGYLTKPIDVREFPSLVAAYLPQSVK